MDTITIDRFVELLREIPEVAFTHEGIDAFLRDHPVDPASLAPYVGYSATHYTRNLIDRTSLYELLSICWDVGQVSPIHNHAGQRCWMAVPIGRLLVQNYEVVREDLARGFCEIVEADRLDMDPAHPAHVQAERPIHAVLNPREHGARATSLHVYSKPYDRCLVYSQPEKTCREVPLFFDTEYGRPV
jgi:cysteine dioxygenase